MGNTESITNDHHHDNGKPQAGSRSRKILKKFEKMHSQKSPSQEESQVEPTTSSPEATDGRKNWLLQLDRENEEPDCPPLSGEYRRIIIRTWAIVEEHISQVGLSTFLELFRRAPESLHFFPFLKARVICLLVLLLLSLSPIFDIFSQKLILSRFSLVDSCCLENATHSTANKSLVPQAFIFPAFKSLKKTFIILNDKVSQNDSENEESNT